MRYNIFMPMASMPALSRMVFPVKVTILNEAGVMIEDNINSVHYNKPRDAVAIKFHEPDPLDLEIQRIQSIIGREGISLRNESVKRILELSGWTKSGERPANVAGIPSGIKAKLNDIDIAAVEKWLRGEGSRRIAGDVGRKIDNMLLAVHPQKPGAANNNRVVVTPYGHSIGYTKAREIWSDLARVPNINQRWRNISSGEFISNNDVVHAGRAIDYNANTKMVTIGCQNIPAFALADLARREGW